MDASIWVMFISKNSDTLDIEHILLKSPIIIHRCGFSFSSTDLADTPFIRFRVNLIVNKHEKRLFCDRALLKFGSLPYKPYMFLHDYHLSCEIRTLALKQGCHWSGKSQGNSRSGKSRGILVREIWNIVESYGNS